MHIRIKVSSIEVKDLTVKYTNGCVAIENINFKLTQSTICALIGMNGSGKSTLFRSIMGLVRPLTGEIKLNNLNINEALKRNIVSYVPQSEEIDWNFPINVWDVVMMGRYGYMNFLRIPKEKDEQIVLNALKEVEMESFMYRQIGELSGGQKKRVFIARALAQESKIILLDEPFTGIDVKTEISIMEILKKLRSKGCLILISTHNLGTIQDFCNQVILLNKKILTYGVTKKVFTRQNLEIIFNGMLRFLHFDKNEDKNIEDLNITVLTDDERAAVFYEKEKRK